MDKVIFRNDFGIIKEHSLVIFNYDNELNYDFKDIKKMSIKKNRIFKKNLVLILICLVFSSFYLFVNLPLLWNITFGVFLFLMFCYSIGFKEYNYMFKLNIQYDMLVLDLSKDKLSGAKQIVYLWHKEVKKVKKVKTVDDSFKFNNLIFTEK